MARPNYKVEAPVGFGSFGIVTKVVRVEDGRSLAMKTIGGVGKTDIDASLRELRVLQSLNSPYIVRYEDSFIDEQGKLCIVTEFAAMGDLYRFIRSRTEPIDEDVLWKFLLQILMGLHHMHSRNVLHRDIKPANVFLDINLNAKLGDMGLAKVLACNEFARTQVGTQWYVPPELVDSLPYDSKSDIWALGVLLYEACMRKLPFVADNAFQLGQVIKRGEYAPITGYSDQLCGIVASCLRLSPAERPSTSELLALPALRHKAAVLGICLEQQPQPQAELLPPQPSCPTPGLAPQTPTQPTSLQLPSQHSRPQPQQPQGEALGEQPSVGASSSSHACGALSGRPSQCGPAHTQSGPPRPGAQNSLPLESPLLRDRHRVRRARTTAEDALLEASRNGCLAEAQRLLGQERVNPNVQDTLGYTSLHHACVRNDVDLARALLWAGARADAQDDLEDGTPLHKACWFGCRATVALLLEKAAPLDSPDKNGETPLHHACAQGHRDVVAMLLRAGADPHARCDAGYGGLTPLDLARARRFHDIVTLMQVHL